MINRITRQFISGVVGKLCLLSIATEPTEDCFNTAWEDRMAVEQAYDRVDQLTLTPVNMLTGKVIDIKDEIYKAFKAKDWAYLRGIQYLKRIPNRCHVEEEYHDLAETIFDKANEQQITWYEQQDMPSDVYLFPTYEEYRQGEMYGECEHCHAITLKAFLIDEDTPNSDLICESCMDDVASCYNCGELMYSNSDWCIYSNCAGEYYCESCYDNRFTHCEDCGTEIYRDDAHWIYDCVYCEHCSDRHYDDYIEDEEDEEYVKSYSWKPSPQFKDKGEDDGLYYGFELEVSGSQRHAPEFLNFFEDSAWSHDHVYLKSDCSIIDGGFEIVTQPMTWKYIKEDFEDKLKNSLDFLKKQGFKGHNKGGLHIHLSRSAIDTNTFMRMQSLLYNSENYDNWLVLTQRKADNIDQWARLTTDKSEDTIRQHYESGYDCVMGSTRYHGLNVTDYTVEMRIFNSNLRIERVMKNLEIAKSLVEFSRTKCHCNFKRYIAWVHKNKATFPNLDAFIQEKGYSAESNTFGNTTEELIEA